MKKRILSLLLALVLVMQFGIVAFAEESNRETSADYYSEQETKTGKEALSVIDIERVAKHYADVQEKNGYEVVSATKQTVYFENGRKKNAETLCGCGYLISCVCSPSY